MRLTISLNIDWLYIWSNVPQHYKHFWLTHMHEKSFTIASLFKTPFICKKKKNSAKKKEWINLPKSDTSICAPFSIMPGKAVQTCQLRLLKTITLNQYLERWVRRQAQLWIFFAFLIESSHSPLVQSLGPFYSEILFSFYGIVENWVEAADFFREKVEVTDILRLSKELPNPHFCA